MKNGREEIKCGLQENNGEKEKRKSIAKNFGCKLNGTSYSLFWYWNLTWRHRPPFNSPLSQRGIGNQMEAGPWDFQGLKSMTLLILAWETFSSKDYKVPSSFCCQSGKNSTGDFHFRNKGKVFVDPSSWSGNTGKLSGGSSKITSWSLCFPLFSRRQDKRTASLSCRPQVETIASLENFPYYLLCRILGNTIAI